SRRWIHYEEYQIDVRVSIRRADFGLPEVWIFEPKPLTTQMFQSAGRILGFPKQEMLRLSWELRQFQSAGRILGFPKSGAPATRLSSTRFNPPGGFWASRRSGASMLYSS